MRIIIAFFCLTVLSNLSIAQLDLSDTINPSYFNQKLLERALFNKVNEHRKRNGVPVLEYNFTIYKVAFDHTNYLKSRKELTHNQTIPGKQKVQDRLMRYTRVRDFAVGENIVRTYVLKPSHNYNRSGKTTLNTAFTYEEAAEFMFTAWKQSKVHNQNMLSNKFKMGAISIHLNKSNKALTAVQVFARLGS